MSGAGCPRDTHPFAALPQGGLPLPGFPLDLHVLGTPPAFVLSQDQTLRRDRVTRPVGRLGVPWKGGRRDRHVPRAGCTTVVPGPASCRALPDGVAHWLLAHCSVLKVRATPRQDPLPRRGSRRPTMVGTQPKDVNRVLRDGSDRDRYPATFHPSSGSEADRKPAERPFA